MKVTLISPYEIGRQPFGLAQPAAWLANDGFEVDCIDLAQERLSKDKLEGADFIALYVAMHTATRIAVEAIPKIREVNPDAALAVYGLYAPMNEALFKSLGAVGVFGGESEPDLLALAQSLRDGGAPPESKTRIEKIAFVTPNRSGLPALDRYADLVMPDDSRKTVAFAETTRGCKHLCRHCPVVPVYEGRFRTVPVDVIMRDIKGQVAAGATHVSFGDPDFLNGPGHAKRVLAELNKQFPTLTFDATVKVEHIIKHADMLPDLAKAGCLFLTCAVESVDDEVLAYFDKGHTAEDFERALNLLRDAGIAMAPTFVAFHPWTTVSSYIDLLSAVARLGLIEAVAPVQLAIRLLIPKGSWMLKIDGFEDLIEPFDDALLGYPWHHRDPAVDALAKQVMELAMASEDTDQTRADVFATIWQAAHKTAGIQDAPLPPMVPSAKVPALSEPWYCCAEPTDAQLEAI